MHYTQQDGRRYHYISDPKFESLFAIADEWEYAMEHPDWADRAALAARPTLVFDSGDDVEAGDFEMRATFYDWKGTSRVLKTVEVLHREDGEDVIERKWYSMPEWRYQEWKEENGE